jgi:hypothetical protein
MVAQHDRFFAIRAGRTMSIGTPTSSSIRLM